MSQDQYILKFIKKVRKRLCRNVFVKTMLWALAVGMLVWGLFNFIALFVPFYGAVLYGFLAFVLCQIAGVIVAVKRYPGMRSTTIQIDSKGLKERVTTAYELAGKNDLCSQLQKNDTIQNIQGMPIRKCFPLKVRKRMYVILFASLIFMVSTAMFPAKTREEARLNHQLEEEIKEKQDLLEELVEEVKENYELTDEQIEALENMLSEAQKELSEATSQEEMAKIQERFEAKLEQQFIDPLEENKEAQAIENSLQSMQNNEGMSQEEQQAVADRFEQLAQEAQDQHMQETAEQMQQELEQNGEVSPETAAQAQQQIQQYMQNNQNQIGQPSQGQQGQQSGQQGQQSGQQGQQSGQQGQQSGQQGQQSGQQGQQSGQQGQQSGQQGQQSGQQGQQSGQQGQQGQQSGQQGQQGQSGQQGQQGQQGQGGEGSNNGNGSGSGGDGWYDGSNYAEEMEGNSNGERVMIPDSDMGTNETLSGQANSNGESYLTESNQVATWSGESVSYEQVIGNYTNQAYSSMNSSNIPDSMKDLVKDYFTELNE